MDTQSQAQPTVSAAKKTLTVKVFGVGTAGVNVIEQLIQSGLTGVSFVAVSADSQSLASCSVPERVCLESTVLRGLGTCGDPERGHALAEENFNRLKTLCSGVDAVFVVSGLGGGAGTGISPVLARAAKEAGALVLGFAMTPFDCEGRRRQKLAFEGLEELKLAADGVVCLTNQKVFKLISENTSVLETFKMTNGLLADGVRGLGRLLLFPGLLEIHFSDVCGLLRDKHTESAFAVAEASGATRSHDVMKKLLSHPMLDGGQVLGESDAVLVSLTGGPDLTMAEVNRVMEQMNKQCEHAQIIMGAAIEKSFRDRLAVTVIAARKDSRPQIPDDQELHDRLVDAEAPQARTNSRFVPPAPSLEPEKVDRLLARQSRTRNGRKNVSRMRQEQLALEIVSKGRFDKSEPTIHKGEDLDVPTYIRRGVSLN
jgi:cell division protein FtsZ